jgi:hypothetical protein
MLHERILQMMPEVKMHVVGKATGASQNAFLQSLKQRFHRQVTYHGYVAEDDLDELFARSRVLVGSGNFQCRGQRDGAALHAFDEAFLPLV